MLNSRKFLVFLLLVLIWLIVIFQSVEYLDKRVTSVSSKPIKGSSRCPEGHILTVEIGGQLGNRIWEYMSVLAIYRLHQKEVNFNVYLPHKIKYPIEILFVRILSFPTSPLSSIPKYCRNFTVYYLRKDEVFDKTKFNNTNEALLLQVYSARYKDVVEYGVDQMRQELKFRDVYKNYCNRALHKIKKRLNTDRNVTFVGMHYRGTDYVTYLKQYTNFTEPANATYYLNAMNYFKSNYQNVIFLLMSTDYRWLKVNLPILLPNNNLVVNYNHQDTAKDLVMLSMCNHSIISYGTYGSTAAFFAGGTTFVYNLGVPLDSRGPTLALGLAELLPNWHVL